MLEEGKIKWLRANEVAEITPFTFRNANAYVLELASVMLGVLFTVVLKLPLQIQRVQMHLVFATENSQHMVKAEPPGGSVSQGNHVRYGENAHPAASP